ncbi:hypothetical protein TYRP_006196 [Tyrophagus putrescentiae]|nr:hypothetical protein TYRP_006196 [Tyrophagus putrescentiae]
MFSCLKKKGKKGQKQSVNQEDGDNGDLMEIISLGDQISQLFLEKSVTLAEEEEEEKSECDDIPITIEDLAAQLKEQDAVFVFLFVVILSMIVIFLFTLGIIVQDTQNDRIYDCITIGPHLEYQKVGLMNVFTEVTFPLLLPCSQFDSFTDNGSSSSF